MDRAPSVTGQDTAQESLLASTNRLATVLSELLPVASAHLGRRDGVTTGSVRLSSHSVQQELEEAGPIFQEVVDGLRSRTAGQRMSLYDRCAASADNGANESSSSGDRRDYGEGGGDMDEGGGGTDEGGGGTDEDGGALDDGGDASVGKAAQAGSVGKAAQAGSVGKAAKPSTHDAARFDSTDTPFQKHASLFARRAYVSVGFQKSLLLETEALCDDCNVFAPGVLDYCRSPSGDRLCYQCDVARHEFVPCWRERWVLVRVGDDCSSAALRAKSETPAETGSRSPSSGSDSVSGTERSASALNS